MQRRQRFGIVDFTEGDSESDDSVKYFCKHCESYGFKERLYNRIYLEGESVSKEDTEQWKMCFECGTLYAIHELERQVAIKNLIESVETPFDIAKNQFLGVDSRKAKRKARKKEELFGDIKDDEVQRELAKGNTLISYTEYQPE